MTHASKSSGQIALVVHPDLGVLSRFQESFARGGIITLLARDLPTERALKVALFRAEHAAPVDVDLELLEIPVGNDCGAEGHSFLS